jgi:DNA-binding Lrp family transcriptional regulator
MAGHMNKLTNRFRLFVKQHSKGEGVKSFKVTQKNEKAFDTVNRGACSVPVDQIVGSVGRYNDFDGKFRLKQHLSSDRLRNIKKAMKEGKPLPHVKLYQIKDEYYAMDGNHRISAAKEFGYQHINADIIEFIPSKNTLENILYREKSEFDDKTKLPYTINLTEMGQYTHLTDQISSHRDFLEKSAKEPVLFESAAADWYETIYRPLTAIIKKAQLIEFFPDRSVADLYAYITYHQWEKDLKRDYGSGIKQLISKNMEDFREKMSNKKEFEYPEMQREMIAFVLMNVNGKKEERIIEKLFSLKEVQEVHSVHGEVDILVKIVLIRDLVSSDAEIIGDFVHSQIRQIPGVIRTKTIIPAFSKIKESQAG